MKKTAISYLKENIKGLCLYIGFSGIFFVIFELYELPGEAVGYAFLIAGFWVLLYGGVGLYRYMCRRNAVLEIEKCIDSGLYELPVAADLIEEDYQRILKNLYESRLEIKSKGRIREQEMADYYGMWVHQIKTPIAALRILLQSYEEDGSESLRETVRDMKLELFKIEQYVEMVLTYLRMESMSSDFIFDVYSLDDVIRQAVRKYSQMFILRKIKLNYRPVNQKLLTDEKWLLLVLEQLLSNALKYTRTEEAGEKPCVSIYIEKEELVIEDNGIGIYPEDLPRVFERGVTGYNGRSSKKSTGIGLYLCKSIMDKLKHGIRIESELGRGTKIFLNFKRSQLNVE
ncbi:MAG: HAMP domain-containing histidine kinase [Dorea sp.]|jgi:signal transduction histidine kinase|nr:HAMP domain-containing histidine kinase [Dorea sp.]